MMPKKFIIYLIHTHMHTLIIHTADSQSKAQAALFSKPLEGLSFHVYIKVMINKKKEEKHKIKNQEHKNIFSFHSFTF